MQSFDKPLMELKDYSEITEKIKQNKEHVQISGCIDSQKVHFISSIAKSYRNTVVITYSDARAKEIYDDYKYFGENVYIYPGKDVIFYSADIHGSSIVSQRIEVLKHLIEDENVTVIMTVDGCMDNLLPVDIIKSSIIKMSQGDIIDIEDLKNSLTQLGYERMSQVDSKGEYAIRGGIIDIYPLTEETPYRIELWDDEIDSIRSFDIESQRSIEQADSLDIYPATEILLNNEIIEEGLKKIRDEAKKYESALRKEYKNEEAHRIATAVGDIKEKLTELGGSVALESYIKYFYSDVVSFIEYFNREDTVFFIDEINRVNERLSTVEKEFTDSMSNRLEKGYILPGQADTLISQKEIMALLATRRTVILSMLDNKAPGFKTVIRYSISAQNVSPYNNSFEILVKDIKRYKTENYRVILLSASTTRARRLSEDLRENGINAFFSDDMDRELKPGEVIVTYGNIHRGYEYPFIKFVVITETDIFGKNNKKKKKKTQYKGQKINSFTELSIGDYVVHENHGLGIYRGIEKVEVDKVIKDYIKIEYASGGNLYILATQLDLIQKYADQEAKKIKLNKLGSNEWNKTKNKVRGAVKEIARDLVKLYAARQEKIGFEYSEDTVWQKEFEEMFQYEETDDQLSAIESTKKDMESTKVMDRLVCGDVGYGKTEIAIRAAFKAVQDNKQVVYLVPTTILAQQHYNTFVQRMKDFPVRIDLMSRFKTQKEQKKTIEDLKKGLVDIVIGTHRVLSKDIVYKDLGLLIIDEEQRFGVAHKEKIKQLKENIDVLTLTATPIPRTLHMSLIGIRDMSVLEEAPIDRQPIQTYVMEYNDEMVREAINRELARGGQVFYVYNRVNNIDVITNQVAMLVPEANVAFAHGQMREHELERIMFDFINGDIDVLVSTTIIETGLDISNVNTMIIHDADTLGLSQLYQLRGRVGRSNRTSFAFLMYKRDKMLKEIAEKRLQAIKEFTDLGSGLKIAMRDLEIRGTGNLLGAEQHGHMEAVGYDLYCKMLNEAVSALKEDREEVETFDTSIDLDVNAFIPASYIKSEFQKLDIYKRIACIENEEEYSDMQDELIDRFGEMPRAVQNLLFIALIKSQAHDVYVADLKGNKKEIKLTMYNRAKIDINKIKPLIAQYRNKLSFVPNANSPYFLYKEINGGCKDAEELFMTVKKLLNDIKMLIES